MNPFLSPEILSGFATAIGSAIITIHSNNLKDRHDLMMAQLTQHQATVDAANAARSHEAKWKGLYWVRSAIALIVICAYFLWPLLPVIIGAIKGLPVQIAVGYYDTVGASWPWQVSMEQIHWIKVGSSAPDAVVSVLDPVRNIAMISIIGFYFGNQAARRA
ncbi:MAG: hypothetical protein AAFX93_18605 [Verrucomicrobiota bacterium]